MKLHSSCVLMRGPMGQLSAGVDLGSLVVGAHARIAGPFLHLQVSIGPLWLILSLAVR